MAKQFVFSVLCVATILFCTPAFSGVKVFGFETGAHIDQVRQSLVKRKFDILVDEKFRDNSAYAISAEGGDLPQGDVLRIDLAFDVDTLLLKHIFLTQRKETFKQTVNILKKKYKLLYESIDEKSVFEAGDYVVLISIEHSEPAGAEVVKVSYLLKQDIADDRQNRDKELQKSADNY